MDDSEDLSDPVGSLLQLHGVEFKESNNDDVSRGAGGPSQSPATQHNDKLPVDVTHSPFASDIAPPSAPGSRVPEGSPRCTAANTDSSSAVKGFNVRLNDDDVADHLFSFEYELDSIEITPRDHGAPPHTERAPTTTTTAAPTDIGNPSTSRTFDDEHHMPTFTRAVIPGADLSREERRASIGGGVRSPTSTFWANPVTSIPEPPDSVSPHRRSSLSAVATTVAVQTTDVFTPPPPPKRKRKRKDTTTTTTTTTTKMPTTTKTKGKKRTRTPTSTSIASPPPLVDTAIGFVHAFQYSTQSGESSATASSAFQDRELAEPTVDDDNHDVFTVIPPTTTTISSVSTSSGLEPRPPGVTSLPASADVHTPVSDSSPASPSLASVLGYVPTGATVLIEPRSSPLPESIAVSSHSSSLINTSSRVPKTKRVRTHPALASTSALASAASTSASASASAASASPSKSAWSSPWASSPPTSIMPSDAYTSSSPPPDDDDDEDHVSTEVMTAERQAMLQSKLNLALPHKVFPEGFQRFSDTTTTHAYKCGICKSGVSISDPQGQWTRRDFCGDPEMCAVCVTCWKTWTNATEKIKKMNGYKAYVIFAPIVHQLHPQDVDFFMVRLTELLQGAFEWFFSRRKVTGPHVQTSRQNTLIAQYFWSEFLSSERLKRVCFCGNPVHDGRAWSHCQCWSRAFKPIEKSQQEQFLQLMNETTSTACADLVSKLNADCYKGKPWVRDTLAAFRRLKEQL